MSDRINCPRCGSPNDVRVTQRDHVCEHCHQPFGEVLVPDHASRFLEEDDSIVRRLKGPAGRVIGGLLAFGAVACGMLVLSAAFRWDAATTGVTCFSSVFFPLLSLIAVVWYLVQMDRGRFHRHEWSKEAGRTVLVFLLLLGVIVGVPLVFFTACLVLR